MTKLFSAGLSALVILGLLGLAIAAKAANGPKTPAECEAVGGTVLTDGAGNVTGCRVPDQGSAVDTTTPTNYGPVTPAIPEGVALEDGGNQPPKADLKAAEAQGFVLVKGQPGDPGCFMVGAKMRCPNKWVKK